jgi:hypothetical protein
MYINTPYNVFVLYLQLFGYCLFYANMYPLIHRVMCYNNRYLTYNDSRRKYIVKNLLKVLAMIYLVFDTFQEVKYIFSDLDLNIEMNIFRNWGMIYVANDLTALIMVDNLPSNTRNHHITSVILLSVLFFFSVKDIYIIKLIVIYTLFSYYALLVNLYLALRFLIKPVENSNDKLQHYFNQFIDFIRVCAYYNYLISLLTNWTIHFIIIYKYGVTISVILYLLFLIPIIKDDVILLGWLKSSKLKL